ncbi:MAG: MarR family winged helix-turn-helix transcriptional regulator [Solirubrobacteraceae bacterium]
MTHSTRVELEADGLSAWPSRLERTGYVERRPNPRDRRSRLVFLTGRGASVTPVTYAAAARVEERWAALTSPQELEALRASLLSLVTRLRDG